MKILFLVPYPMQEAPSQRFRFEQYFEILLNQGHSFKAQSFLPSQHWKLFFKTGKPVQKVLTLIRGFAKRIYIVTVAPSFDFIFIHRETAPIGPPIFEWILAMILRKKIIYDFDDAIWLTDRIQEPALLKTLKWRQKVKAICRWSYKVSCGNEYLRNFALQYNPNAIYNPTTIECDHKHNPALFEQKKINEHLIIGWTGSHSTLKYLLTLEAVLQKLEEKFPFISFLVIADQPPPIQLQRLTCIQWNAQTEIADLLKIDIGIMPLPDDEWANGKCGFKALQYMALEIPCIASPVGVNTTIIQHGVNGFLCASEQEWLHTFDVVLSNEILRRQIGKQGRMTVKKNYSVDSNASTFLSMFE